MTANRHLAIFETERRRLTGLAYRMTGSVADSEDMVQQAWIRWSRQDLAHIEAPSQWLGAVVTRLCLDDLKSARSRRETYVGAWLPDPLVQDEGADVERDWIVSEDISIALVLTLKNLSPEMRAAFILRDGFDYSFDEIAEIVGREPPTCRQLVSRARRKLAGAARLSRTRSRSWLHFGRPAGKATCRRCSPSLPMRSRFTPMAAVKCRRHSTF